MASKPFLAGMALGGLAFKPQLCVLLPIFILAGRHWRVALGASVLICVWTLASLALFGFESWLAFFETLSTTRHVIMDQQGFGFERMQTVFSAVRLLVGPVSAAYALQIVSTLAVMIVVFWLGRKNIDHRLQSAGLLASVLLATPYAFDYDMMVIAPAIAFFASYGLERGFRAYEKSVMTLAWFVPFVARGLAHVTPLPIGVLSTVILLVLIVQRAHLERQSGEALLQPHDFGPVAGPVPWRQP
jgi:hypothetical protein